MKIKKIMKKLVKLEETLWMEIVSRDDINSDDSLYEADTLMTQAYQIMEQHLYHNPVR